MSEDTEPFVGAFRVESEGALGALNRLPSGGADPCHVSVDRSGKFLLVANYSGGSIAVFGIDAKNGTLTPAGHVPSLGKTPRNITIDPTNTYLLAANQAGDNVVVFRIDHKTGHLTPTGSQQPVAQAAAVAFVKNP